MNREMHDSQAKAVLPPGFWSQAPSDQLHRLEQLLQQFLSLPGFQQAPSTAAPQASIDSQGMAGTPFPAQSQAATQPSPAANSSQGTGWAPSGSTWGPLAEAWKQVQQEKQAFAPKVETPAGNFAAPKAPFIQETPDKITWQFPTAPSDTLGPIPAWNLTAPEERVTWNESNLDSATAFIPQEPLNAHSPRSATKANHPGGEKASIPVQVGWPHKTLVIGNRMVDGCLKKMGWPGRGLQSTFGKWVLGLAGVCLLTGGTWLYFREAVDEIVGQIGFGEMAPP